MGRKTVEILARRLAFGAGCAPRTGAHARRKRQRGCHVPWVQRGREVIKTIADTRAHWRAQPAFLEPRWPQRHPYGHRA
jgi:hypothetical protein